MQHEKTQDQIVEYLRKTYKPNVIVLAGSRAQETSSSGSDWDIFIFCKKKYSGGFFEFNGEKLDLTFHEWPKPKDYFMTIPYGPIYPVRILFDDTDGAFAKVLSRTKRVFNEGPLKRYKISVDERLQKLERWQGKLEKHTDDIEAQFYYAGYVYEFFVRVWFELQNMWPLPPAQAFPFIKTHDRMFAKHLREFAMVSGRQRAIIARQLIARLRKLQVDAPMRNL